MSYLIETKDITKRFGGLVAVDKMSFGVSEGEVVAILGDNGAGKSTLIKMISGVYPSDGGTIYYDGEEAKIHTPMDALAVGIETIYQDLALAENLNIYSNIFLGREKTKKKFGFIPVLDHDYMYSESIGILKKLGIKIPSLKNNVRTLSGGQRQAVAISRSIYWNAKVLIMDEPTAALGVAQQKQVLDLVNSLKDHGLAIILISHQMRDVFEVADRIIVMRRGEKVGDLVKTETSTEEVVSLIVGSEMVN